MEFIKNTEYARQIGQTYGEYVCTFHSDQHQVTAELFRQNGSLTAYVSIREDLSASDVTDDYYSPLRKKAEELGFKDHFRIIYAGR